MAKFLQLMVILNLLEKIFIFIFEFVQVVYYELLIH